ncbi:hypothetical protein [Parasphingorhabdus sp.]|uniref:hypothetical protein n=1 Tax=Parasphingorhabdus sp. TaxID=2709688 RepID=UPI00326599AC
MIEDARLLDPDITGYLIKAESIVTAVANRFGGDVHDGYPSAHSARITGQLVDVKCCAARPTNLDSSY